MPRFPRRVGARFVAFVRADIAGVRAGFVALLISSGGDLVTGVTLGIHHQHPRPAARACSSSFPAAIGMRGNVFGALGQPPRHA